MATKIQAGPVTYATRDWADAQPADERNPGRAHLLKLTKTALGLVASAACGSQVRLSGQNGATKHKCTVCLRIHRRQLAAARSVVQETSRGENQTPDQD
jgi:hypothetical protein